MNEELLVDVYVLVSAILDRAETIPPEIVEAAADLKRPVQEARFAVHQLEIAAKMHGRDNSPATRDAVIKAARAFDPKEVSDA